MFQLIVFLMGIFAAQSIEFTTYASRTDCNDPWKTTTLPWAQTTSIISLPPLV
jgi:hypothetical protein